MRSLGWVLSVLASAVIGAGLPVCCLAGMDCCAVVDACAAADCDACDPVDSCLAGDGCEACRASDAPRESVRRPPPAPHGFGCACADRSLVELGLAHSHAGAEVAMPALAPVIVPGLELPPPAVAATVRPARCAPPRAAGALRLPLLL